jgi:hypothetical protein
LKKPVRILFFMRNLRGYLRFFEPVLRVLGERGHSVHIVYDEPPDEDEQRWVERFRREHPGITLSRTPVRSGRLWHHLGREIRLSLDYLRFLRPEFANAPSLKGRPGKDPPRVVMFASRLPLAQTRPVLPLMTGALRLAERALPPNPAVAAFIARQQPDVVMFTPYLAMGSVQPVYLRCAKAVGARTMVCVASWDNLSSKSLIRDLPDAVTVWNETQKKELVELHRIPAERIVVTGAQNFDPWFEWKAGSREEFCRKVGLDPQRPYVLYLGSALYAASITEPEFARQWIRRIRASSDPRLREAGVLLRPHPNRNREWTKTDFSELGNVAVWPRSGEMPVAAEARADFHDSLYHSAAVMGLNTSALIEAVIVGRPVHTLLTPEFANSQLGTLHFKYLMEIEGGCLRVARSFEEHLGQLAEALTTAHEGRQRHRRFLEAFVRPGGIDTPAAPAFVDAIEDLAARPAPLPLQTGLGLHAVRTLLYPLAVASEAARRIRNARLKGLPLYGSETFSRVIFGRPRHARGAE